MIQQSANYSKLGSWVPPRTKKNLQFPIPNRSLVCDCAAELEPQLLWPPLGKHLLSFWQAPKRPGWRKEHLYRGRNLLRSALPPMDHPTSRTGISKGLSRRKRSRTFGWRCIDHQLEALLRCGKLRDVLLRVRSSDMLLHRTIALLLKFNWAVSNPRHSRRILHQSFAIGRNNTHAQTAFPTLGAIIVGKRTHHFIASVRGRKGACEGGSRWHGLAHPSLATRDG